MKRSPVVFLPLLLLVPLILVTGCVPADPPPYIDCDAQALVDAITDANGDPDPTTIELSPGCVYSLEQEYQDQTANFEGSTALPIITTEVTLIGNGAVITRPDVSADFPHYRLLGVSETGTLRMSDLDLVNGSRPGTGLGGGPGASDFGGAILNKGSLEVEGIHFNLNRANNGGAIANHDAASLIVRDSLFEQNLTGFSGGAIYNRGQAQISTSEFLNNQSRSSVNVYAGNGGAIWNTGDITISSCQFSQNRASHNGSVLVNKDAGASMAIISSSLYLNQLSDDSSTLVNLGGSAAIINSTFSDNSTRNGHQHAIENQSGFVEISFSTIANYEGQAPVIASDNANLSIANTIVADNWGPENCSYPPGITTQGNNLSSDPSCLGFSLIDDPLIEPLANNGGSTQTHALDPLSPAINQALGSCPAVDQRGVSRPIFMECDLGAYESDQMDRCTIEYLVYSIHDANSDPDPSVITLEPGCEYVVEQPYGDDPDPLQETTGLPLITSEVEIVGNGASITRPKVDVQPEYYRLMAVGSTGILRMDSISFSNGIVGDFSFTINAPESNNGGAVFNAGYFDCANCVFHENISRNGGAIYNAPGSSLIVSGSSLENNLSHYYGGAIANDGLAEINLSDIEFNKAARSRIPSLGWGGGIRNTNSLTISDCVFSSNNAKTNGGAISNEGPSADISIYNSLFWNNANTYENSTLFNSEGSTTTLNSTFSLNGQGGLSQSILENVDGRLNISFTTIAVNYCHGGAIKSNNSNVSFANSIVADHRGVGNCSIPGGLTVFGNNLSSDDTCSGFSIIADPKIEYIKYNGGYSSTIALYIDSPALNAASGECPITDQRGISRPQGIACDLGAYEYDGPQPTPSPTAAIDHCLFEALRNTNCRLSDCTTAEIVTTLPMGETAQLVGMNPQGTHGLFELQTGEACWMLMGLLTGGDALVCNPVIAIPPLCPTPVEGGIDCAPDLDPEDCTKAGGTPDINGFVPCICP